MRISRTAGRRLVTAVLGVAVAVPGAVVLGAGQTQAAARLPWCNPTTGPYQRQIEKYLKLPADGRQSPSDCRAVQRFQTKHGITPNAGYAGPITWARIKDLKARANPNAAGKCPVNRGRIACVDLTRQLVWVQKGRKVVYTPVHVRTGRKGYVTRTGLHRVYWRHKNHVSTLYDVKMPYSQFFDGGIAFHAIAGSVYSPPGSHGCVNMRLADARKLWGTLHQGDPVYVYGRKPGT